MRLPLVLTGLALVLLAVLAAVGLLMREPQPAGQTRAEPQVGSPAPPFELELAGEERQLSLASLRGKPVWVNFWATWCPPCRAEMPEMERLYRQHRDAGLEIVAVNVRESPARILDFTRELSLTFPTVRDPEGKVTDLYYVSGLPTHFFISRDGTIRAIHVGGLDQAGGQSIETYLSQILAP
jgi:cytochrome c biogenesis protein CcmG, thiol:disulfide interchange protein DsbE